MRSSPDLRSIRLGAALLGIAVLGVVAERQRYGWADTREWAPDLLVGWTLAGLGIAAFALRRPRGAATLLLLSGVAWFVGNFYELEPGWLGSAAEALAWLNPSQRERLEQPEFYQLLQQELTRRFLALPR